MSDKYEFYDSGDDGAHWFRDDNDDQEGQTFTTVDSFEIEYVKVYVAKVSTGGIITARIYAVDESDLPTEAALATGTFDASGISGNTWVTVTFAASYVLTAATKYAIVLSSDGWGFNWQKDGSSPTYLTGNRVYSTDNGSNWAATAGTDFLFETWGIAAVDPPLIPSDVVTYKRLVVAGNDEFWYENI